MHVVVSSPLAERIAEAIEDFSEANVVTVAEVLDALEWAYAYVERRAVHDEPKDQLN